jgi:hypothetical protein
LLQNRFDALAEPSVRELWFHSPRCLGRDEKRHHVLSGGDAHNDRDASQVRIHTVENGVPSHRRGNGNAALNPIFPLADRNLVDVKDKLSVPVTNMLPERFDRRFTERSRNLKSRVLLGKTFHLDAFALMSDEDRVNPSSRDLFAEFVCAVV